MESRSWSNTDGGFQQLALTINVCVEVGWGGVVVRGWGGGGKLEKGVGREV